MTRTRAPLCPLTDRRSSKEVWLALFVAHFTTILAFCHLLSIRGDRILSWRLFFQITSPFLIITQHALALLVILAALLYALACGNASPKMAYTFLHRLLGTTKPISEVDTNARHESLIKRLGRITVVLAFLTQCITTIYLYSRRVSRNAVTFADQRIFELACGGILTALLTLGFFCNIPPFSDVIPDPSDIIPSRAEDVVAFLRDPPGPVHSRWGRLEHPTSAKFLANLLLAAFTITDPTPYSVAKDNHKSIGEYGPLSPKLLHGLRQHNPVVITILAILLPAIAFPLIFVIMKISPQRGRQRTIKLLLLLLLSPVIGALEYALVTLIYCTHIFFSNLVMRLVFVIAAIKWEMAGLRAWPIDEACPLLWKDDVKDWVWSLS
jgi:hypothetical protein